MKSQRKFKYNQYFTKDDIKKFPQGWIYHEDQHKYMTQDLINKSSIDMTKQIIFIKPDIWGEAVLKSEYWKDPTYHPSLFRFNQKTIKNKILLIGKVIKKKNKQKTKYGDSLYETVLMCNSEIQINDFTERQCSKMLNCNILLDKKDAKDEKSNPTITKTERRMQEKHSVKQIKTIEKIITNESVCLDKNYTKRERSKQDVVDVIQSNHKIVSSKKNKRKRIQSNQNEDLDIIHSNQNVKNDRSTNSSLKQTKTHPKKKLSSRSVKKTQETSNEEDKSDFLLQQNVAFDLENDAFKRRLESEMSKAIIPPESLVCGRYIIGCVFERLAKKERNNQFYSYKIAFEYAGDGMKDMVFSMEEIFLAAQLYKDVLQQKKVQSNKRVTGTLNPIVDPEQKSIYKFNADDVNGDAIESDDEEEEDEMKEKLIRVREGNCYFYRRFQGTGIKDQFNTNLFMEYSREKNSRHLEKSRGLTWNKNVEIDAPCGIRPDRSTFLKREHREKFRSEIESLLAFLPVGFWLYHLKETNNYMKSSIEQKAEDGTEASSLSEFREISFDELMIFYAIIIQMAMKPNPGSRYTESWKTENKVWYTACNHMSKNRFQEIRAALHWCDNRLKDQCVDSTTKKKDTLYKIRPLLSIIEANLGKYLEPCTELSLDETCVAIRSQYARAVTFYNPNKPKGKHHLKFYTLCENSHWCALEIKMCHRFKKDESNVNETEVESKETKNGKTHCDDLSDNSSNENEIIESDVESADEYNDSSDDDSSDDDSTVTDSDNNMSKDMFDDLHEIEDENIPNPQMENNNANHGQSQCEKVAQKTVQTVTSLCKKYKKSGRIINMDNLYSSPLVFIKLKEMSLYARGTVRLNRKYLPRFIKYLKKDMKKLPRGSYQFAVNKDYHMSMHCWHDKNPVHVLSTADSTKIEEVKRKQGKDKIIVKCPSTVKNYNTNMQAVDQFNKLMSLFSLAQAHTFTKYYKKIAMVLMDFVLVNSYLHHKLYVDSIPSIDRKRRKKITRKKYMENLIDALIETDWAKTARDYERRKEEKLSGRKRSFAYDSDENIDENSEKEHYFNEVEVDMAPELPPLPEEFWCKAISFDSKVSTFERKSGDKNKHKFFCKVCQFEGRGDVRKGTVFCSNHGLSLCQQINTHPKNKTQIVLRTSKIMTSEITDWEWLSPNQDRWTCWEKAHKYYIPQGLFKSNRNGPINIDDFDDYAGFNFSSSPYLHRKVALKNSYYKRIGTRTEKKFVPERN